MSIALDNPISIGAYIDGMIDRIDHHGVNGGGMTSAAGFKALVLTTFAKVCASADPDSITVKEYSGRPANLAWASFGGRRYAFAFNHNGTIEIRARTLRGAPLHILHEAQSTADVARIIAAL
jgi:hypothetical protein